MFWVGILLLVSAGSFLYVATIHILPEVFGQGNEGHSHGHGSAQMDHSETKMDELDMGKRRKETVETPTHFSKAIELLTITAGLALPLCLMFLHDED